MIQCYKDDIQMCYHVRALCGETNFNVLHGNKFYQNHGCAQTKHYKTVLVVLA